MVMVPAQPRGRLVTPFPGEDSELEHVPSGGSHIHSDVGTPSGRRLWGSSCRCPPLHAPPLRLGFSFLERSLQKTRPLFRVWENLKLIIWPSQERGLHCPLVELVKRL